MRVAQIHQADNNQQGEHIMKKANLVIALALTAVVLGGCYRGMKVTFINNTTKDVDVEFVTQGGRTVVGKIPAGDDKSICKKFNKELLPADFNITIYGGTPDSNTRIVLIEKDHPKKLQVCITGDKQIKVYAGDEEVPTR